MRIQVFVGAVLMVMVPRGAASQEPAARKPDLIAAPRLIPPASEGRAIVHSGCAMGAGEAGLTLLGSTAVGAVAAPIVGFFALLVLAPIAVLVLPADGDEQLYPDGTFRALQIAGAAYGFGAGI